MVTGSVDDDMSQCVRFLTRHDRTPSKAANATVEDHVLRLLGGSYLGMAGFRVCSLTAFAPSDSRVNLVDNIDCTYNTAYTTAVIETGELELSCKGTDDI